MTDEYDTTSLIFRNDRAVWYRPTTLQELLHLKSKFPHAKLVIGNTEIGKNYIFQIYLPFYVYLRIKIVLVMN